MYNYVKSTILKQIIRFLYQNSSYKTRQLYKKSTYIVNDILYHLYSINIIDITYLTLSH